MRQERDLNRESGNFGYAAGLSGRRGEAVTIAKEMEVKYAGAKTLGMHVTFVYAGIGNRGRAFDWLEKDFQNRVGGRLTRCFFRTARCGNRLEDHLAR